MELQHPYVGVMTAHGLTFGGDQRQSRDAVLRRCGCGLVAAADLLRYLWRFHPDCRMPAPYMALKGEEWTQEQYDALLRRLRQRYFPLFYPTGLNGLGLALGLNRLFRRLHMPYTARWGVPRAVLFETMEEMLRQDLPVILSVGPNFPRVWRRERLLMQREGCAGMTGVRAHYMTITALDETTITVSSWGQKYRIRRSDYSRYVRRSSSPLVSNLLWLRPKQGSEVTP